MQFENDAQRQCYERVKTLMRQMYGEQASVNPDVPQLGITSGSAWVSVAVHPLNENSIVSVLSYVVTEVEPSFELYQYLLRKGHDLLFGAFSVDEQGDIAFSHQLYGDTLDREELEWAIGAVAFTADEQDDEIVKRWGGLRAVDRVRV
jgi:Putative bacterial sensory transduction regulator